MVEIEHANYPIVLVAGAGQQVPKQQPPTTGSHRKQMPINMANGQCLGPTG